MTINELQKSYRYLVDGRFFLNENGENLAPDIML